MDTPTPVLESALLSLLEIDGERGGSFQVGNQKAETLGGPRPLGLNFPPDFSSVNQQRRLTSKSMETIGVLLSDGGKGEAGV